MAQQPAGGQQGGGGGAGGDGNDMMWIAAFFAGFLVVMWLIREKWFPIVFKIRLYELQLIDKIYSVDNSLFQDITNAIHYPEHLTRDGFTALLTESGSYYNLPVLVFLFILAIILYIKNPGNKFNNVFNIASFRKVQSQNWPQILPPSNYDLINTDINEGPWASSLTPLNFARKYKLLDVIVNENYNPLLGELPKVAKLKEKNAEQVFAQQLGEQWMGPENLPIHTQALFAVFAAIANQDRKTGFTLLRQFNEAFRLGKKPNYNGVKEVLNKYKDTKLVKKVESRHNYVMTVMAAMLELARTDGVLACADFLWLKTIDRKLWYMLHNVGRRAAFPEVAGAVAHWRIEARMQKKLVSPMVHEAVKALKIGIAEIIYPEDWD